MWAANAREDGIARIDFAKSRGSEMPLLCPAARKQGHDNWRLLPQLCATRSVYARALQANVAASPRAARWQCTKKRPRPCASRADRRI